MKSILLISLAVLVSGCFTGSREQMAQFLVAGVKAREAEYRATAKDYIDLCRDMDFDGAFALTSPLTIENAGKERIKEDWKKPLSEMLQAAEIEWREWSEVAMDETYNVGLTFSFRLDSRTFFMDVFEEEYDGERSLYVLNVRDTRDPR